MANKAAVAKLKLEIGVPRKVADQIIKVMNQNFRMQMTLEHDSEEWDEIETNYMTIISRARYGSAFLLMDAQTEEDFIIEVGFVGKQLSNRLRLRWL